MATRTRFTAELGSAIRPQPLAALVEAGVPRRALQGPKWRRTSHGFYRPAVASDPDRCTPTQRILDTVPLIPPGGAIGEWAAAYMLGVDVLDGVDPFTMTLLPVPVYMGRDLGRRPTPTASYLRARLPEQDVQRCNGIAVTTPLRTAFDGARRSGCLSEAVAFVDACAQQRILAVADLEQYVAERRAATWAGIAMARKALTLADMASRNPWESRLRVCYVCEGGLPRPLVNCPVFDRSGALAGIVDLFDAEAGLVVEFDGSGHRQRRQHREDNVREERLEALGLVVVRADSLDLMHHRPGLVRRIVDSYHRGLGRDRSRDRWTLTEPEWWLEQQDPTMLLSDTERIELFERL